jgi:glycosyltransferase involved in cell wall biosynthesis
LSIAGDGGAMNEVKEVIKARELSDVDIHGFVSGESKRQVLRDAHVYLFPSWHGEGLPNSLLEAMGCGMPILTTANAGIKDFFQQPEMGFILKDCSSDELETRLIDLLKDREMQLKMALFNYSYAKEHFAANKVVDRLEQIYSKV